MYKLAGTDEKQMFRRVKQKKDLLLLKIENITY